MKRIEIGLIICTAVVIALGLYGCEDGSADENKPISEVQAEADKMDVEQLKAMAIKYKDAIAAKKDEAGEVMKKLQAIPATEQLGKEATEIKNELETLTNSLKALQTRFQVYYDKLKAKGGNI